MINEYKGYKVGDLIEVTDYPGCALWWYSDAYKKFGKTTPNQHKCEHNSNIWKLEAILEPEEIRFIDKRYLFYLTNGEDYVIIETNNDNEFRKIASYALTYKKRFVRH